MVSLSSGPADSHRRATNKGKVFFRQNQVQACTFRRSSGIQRALARPPLHAEQTTQDTVGRRREALSWLHFDTCDTIYNNHSRVIGDPIQYPCCLAGRLILPMCLACLFILHVLAGTVSTVSPCAILDSPAAAPHAKILPRLARARVVPKWCHYHYYYSYHR